MGLNEIVKIGDKIRKYRKDSGLTQKEMALKLGIPYSTYSNYENNNRTPNIDVIYCIADILNVDVNDFFSANSTGSYFEFLSLMIGWAEERGYDYELSHDDETFLKNNGGQSLYIIVDNERFEFAPSEIDSYSEFVSTYFDIQLDKKRKKQ